TALVEHDFHEGLSLRNLTRYQVVTQDATTSAVQGAFCTLGGVNPYLTRAGAVQACTVPAGQDGASGPRGQVGSPAKTRCDNETDLTSDFHTGDWKHTLVVGLALTHEEYNLVNGSLLRNADGSTITAPNMLIANPDGIWPFATNFIQGGGATSGTPPTAPSGS